MPIAALAGDQHAALFGQMCLQPGMVKNTYGTGCFMLMNVGDKPRARAPVVVHRGLANGRRDPVCAGGQYFYCRCGVQWLRDGLQIIERWADVQRLASQVTDNGGVYLVPAFAGVGAPHWDAYARGTIIGVTRGTSAAHIARAALESIAYQTADVLEAMQADAKLRIQALRVDGGAAMNDLLMQFQADILGVPVVRPQSFEATALGAGYLAGLAVGVWKNAREIERKWRVERTFQPQMPPAQVKQLRAGWNKALKRSLQWADA